MTKKDDEKSGARERTAQHLKKVLAAAAGLALNLQSVAGADVTPPKGGDGEKKPGDVKKEPEKPKEESKERLGYEVVDMIPEPAPDPKKAGFLKVESNPSGAAIMIDGRDVKLKTPQKKLKLAPGTHIVTLTVKGQEPKNFTVEIKSGETATQRFDVRPPPPK